ncbi:MAG: hypothetical protein K6G10_03660 [Butyrivibrio sp.]|nr:hypothetical protein [Butyrivibrio sp.]
MLNNIRSYFYKFKRFQSPLEKYVFPIILLLFPLAGVNAGLDITDVTYNMANFRFMELIDPMWILSTYVGNSLGYLIMKLPGAGSLLGFGIYCSFLFGAVMLVVYYVLQKFMPGWMIFLGLLMAEGLSWCPRVIMYNYCTYYLMTFGALFLLAGIFAMERQNLYLFLAGVCLGMNVMVRFPNVTQSMLILVLWFYGAVAKEKFREIVKETLVCIGGYATGFAIPLVFISITYGPTAYFDMIGNLFGMTKGASDYTAGVMVASIMEAYLTTGRHMLIMIPCIMAGIIMFLFAKGKYVPVKKILYILGLLILVRYYFASGVFTRNYYYYDSIFQAAMMFVIITLVISIIASFGILNGSKQEQTLGFLLVMIILITPLGSNNYTFPIINNLYLVAPIGLWLLRRLMQRLGEGDHNFPWQAMVTTVIIVCLIQGALFRFNFSFVDGADGTKRDTKVTFMEKGNGLVTTKSNADSLNELSSFLRDNGLYGEPAIFFGSVPGLSYFFDMEPSIDTVWPDLDSYTTEHFDAEMSRLSGSDDPEPTVIVGFDSTGSSSYNYKYDILLDYIANHDYNKVFESDRFTVYCGGIESEE